MKQHNTLFVQRLGPYLSASEKVFAGLSLVGLGLGYAGMNAISAVVIGLAGLAIVFFLFAFQLPPPTESDEPLQFKHLLVSTIAPKVAWISCAVSVMGILFFILDLGNKNYKQMIIIGGSALAFALLITVFSGLTDNASLNPLKAVLYRAIPIMIIDLYVFLN